MSFLIPRVAFTPVVCGPARHEFAPLFNLFDDTFNTINQIERASRRQHKPWNPRFDVKEDKDGYAVQGEVPGVEQKDLSIEFTDEHTLVIKGRSERHTQQGQRPEAVEAEKPAAAIENTSTPASEASVKSHQATIEDESTETPANDSAFTEAQPVMPTEEVVTTPEQPKSDFWVSERRVGEFKRSFAFPSRVNQDEVKASLKNGILSILVPKAAVPESRRIDIE